MKLASLIGSWLHNKNALRDHFLVQPHDPNYLPTRQYEAWITYRCTNGSDFRRAMGLDCLIKIFDSYIIDGTTRIEAADPEIFVKLERILRRKHDRTGSFQMVTFRNDCPTQLRNCGCLKLFCGC